MCYKHGGFAFLITYCVSLIFVGIPMFYLELNLGQFTSSSMLTCWTYLPIMKGVGFCMIMLLCITSIYYMSIITWGLWYFGYSIVYRSESKWTRCDNEWNTPHCILLIMKDEAKLCLNETVKAMYNTSVNLANGRCYGSRNLTFGGETKLYHSVPLGDLDKSVYNISHDSHIFKWTLPTEEFFYSRLTKSTDYDMNKFGTIQWELAVCSGILWILSFLAIIKGMKYYGKIVYFTNFAKCTLLLSLLLRGLLLKGREEGLKVLYDEFNINQLLGSEIWVDSVKQTIFSLGLCEGTLITLASFNRFHNETLKDTILVTLTNHIFSILCGLTVFSFFGEALRLAVDSTDDVFLLEHSIDFLFIVVPFIISYIPASASWTSVLFLLILFLGIDTSLAYVNSIKSSLYDLNPNYFRKRNIRLSFGLCFIFFLLGLPLCCNGGLYLTYLLDIFTKNWIKYILCFLECISIVYIYGVTRFTEDVGLMIGSKKVCFICNWSCSKYWWIITWGVITPISAIFVFVFEAVEYESFFRLDYYYPKWSEVLGWLIAISGGLVLIGYGAFKLVQNLLKKDIGSSFRPSKQWGPYLLKHRLQVVYAQDFCLDPHNVGVDFVDLLKSKISNNSSKV
ncbi:DgyrCDS7647 [Dimorphilus gyrociliatus]|nr:DgyrCDS7647 [Dimorphilus gyrociliatus]